MNNKTPINMFQVTGRVVYKAYYESSKRLLLIVASGMLKGNKYISDYPVFTIEGEEAEAIQDKIERNSHVTVKGHLETESRMRYEGNRMYRQYWELVPIVEDVEINVGGIGANNVFLAGEVLRVYRNPEEGKKFYMIILRIPVEGRNTQVSFTYFDHDMVLEPGVGDFISMSGLIQSRTITQENGTRRARRYTQMGIVARTVSIQRTERNKNRGSNGKPKLMDEGIEIRDPEEKIPNEEVENEIVNAIIENVVENNSSEAEVIPEDKQEESKGFENEQEEAAEVADEESNDETDSSEESDPDDDAGFVIM